MAERRMFAKTIIDSDAFLDMSLTTQCLYFHLSMRADDEGFINNPRKIQRMIGCNDDDLRVLIARKFIIPFESGIVVIKHWRIHNYIQKDRRKDTVYRDERAMLEVQENNAYSIIEPDVSNLDTPCIQNVSSLDSQVRLGKSSLGKSSLGKSRLIEEQAPQPLPIQPKEKRERHKYGQYKNVLLDDTEMSKLQEEFPNDWAERIERLSEYIASTGKSYKSHLATIRSWARRDTEKPAPRYQKKEAVKPSLTLGNDEQEAIKRLMSEA